MAQDPPRTCLDRRHWLRLGCVSLLSGGLVHVLRSRAGGGSSARAKACIILFQVGGPYQCETLDPKPGAPAEARGPFRPIATTAPGVFLTEAFPLVARQAKDFAIVRSVHHVIRCHNPAIYCSLVGREATEPLAVSNRTAARRTDHPHYASVAARLRGGRTEMPHHVVIPDHTNNGPAKSPGILAGYLGAAYDPFVLGRDPAAPDFRVDGLGLPSEVAGDRFASRLGLLDELDRRCRALDAAGGVATMGVFYERAFDVLTSARAKRAFTIEEEPPRLRDRYGWSTSGQGALLARRLVEAGVPFVTVFSHVDVDKGSWDTHQQHDERVKNELLPPADQSLSALLEDLAARGLLDDTLVVWMGEFGRTPRRGVNFSNNTNNVGGRDHWCNCYSVLLAGGGIRGGQVVGSSDWMGAYPKERPVHVSDLAATIFHALGIDPRAEVVDIQGQPHAICDGYPVLELF